MRFEGLGGYVGRCLLVLLAAQALAACQNSEVPVEHRIFGGDGQRGREIITAIGCGACHAIPGILGARGIVGPSLEGFGRRQLIGGVLPNESTILIQWVSNAPSLIPETGMPALPLSQDQARDIAAYLYTLR